MEGVQAQSTQAAPQRTSAASIGGERSAGSHGCIGAGASRFWQALQAKRLGAHKTTRHSYADNGGRAGGRPSTVTAVLQQWTDHLEAFGGAASVAAASSGGAFDEQHRQWVEQQLNLEIVKQMKASMQPVCQ